MSPSTTLGSQARWTVPTRRQYRWVLRNALELASTLAGHSVGILEFLQDEALLGQTLATATTADGSREVSAWLVAQRRSVLRSFIELMEPELKLEGIGRCRRRAGSRPALGR